MNDSISTGNWRLRAVSWLFTVLPLFAGVNLVFEAVPGHGMDPDWPAHARYHVTWASLKFLALGIIVAIIARTAFAAGQRWSWWALAVYVAVVLGGVFMVDFWQGGGPGLGVQILVGAMTAVLALGLLLTAGVGLGSRSTASGERPTRAWPSA